MLDVMVLKVTKRYWPKE